MSLQHPVDRGGSERGRFAELAERASNLTSSPLFFTFCLVLVAFFIAVHLAHLSLAVQLLAGDLMTAVTLLLLALLKNSELRAEHAIQRKLDALAAALLESVEDQSGQAAEDLKKVIRMEEET
ncbi:MULTISPECIES: low affinity iron permease family protein [Streptomyces]|uniref:low affinity iron permease family protein n=1 Tax=Streptomyces TaxID=1883 RepID=UPI001F1E9C80|nr:low affinity iron permease family protein [Streptomyces noursei]MCE4946657.1 low affinity iron permease family protein [Streptomyces noursei]